MPLITTAMTPLQESAIASNLIKSGPFFYSRDLHPMLDCASPNDRFSNLAPPTGVSLPMSVPLGVPFTAKLRQEFFGGVHAVPAYEPWQGVHRVHSGTALVIQGGTVGVEQVTAAPDPQDQDAAAARRPRYATNPVKPNDCSNGW